MRKSVRGFEFNTDCLICKKSCADPECGYMCKMILNERTADKVRYYFPNDAQHCPHYQVDADYLRKKLEDFINIEEQMREIRSRKS